jgi:inhibitor of cysteine peptidase
MTLTESNDGEVIRVRVKEEIELRLPENPTTGFRWSVVRSDRLVEEPVESGAPQTRPAQPTLIGAGGIRTFRFRPRETGTGRLELKLWREFEGDSSVVRRFAVDVTVEDE